VNHLSTQGPAGGISPAANLVLSSSSGSGSQGGSLFKRWRSRREAKSAYRKSGAKIKGKRERREKWPREREREREREKERERERRRDCSARRMSPASPLPRENLI